MNRPISTLFMLSSVGMKKGLCQYYELERWTGLWSLCTGKTQAKIGVNKKKVSDAEKIEVLRLVMVDNKPHLKKSSISYLAARCKTLYIIITNKKHPAFEMKRDNTPENLEIIYTPKLDVKERFKAHQSIEACKMLCAERFLRSSCL